MLDLQKPTITETGCWQYQLALSTQGYYRTTINGIFYYLHIYNYEQKYGKVPDGYELDHKCKNRACANPDHLETVTHVENVNRGKTTKYKEDMLIFIKVLIDHGLGYKRIGRILNIHPNSINYIIRHRLTTC